MGVVEDAIDRASAPTIVAHQVTRARNLGQPFLQRGLIDSDQRHGHEPLSRHVRKRPNFLEAIGPVQIEGNGSVRIRSIDSRVSPGTSTADCFGQ